MKILRFNTIVMIILFLNISLRSERFFHQTELEQIIFLDQLLQTSENLKLQVIDDFEENYYSVISPSTPLHQLEIVFKHPGLSLKKEQKRGFELEQVLVGGWGNTLTFDKSLMFYYNVEIPGKQHYTLIRKEPIVIRGQPVQYSLWIHSKNYSDKLFLIFLIDEKEFRLPVTQLNFEGWRRVENLFPKNFMYVPRLNQLKGYYKFKGFFIQSLSKKEKGNREILLDHFIILSDFKKLQYPGNELLDNF